MARAREFEPQETLDKAMALFWSKGYSDTSMDDLVNATGVSRYGIYGTFGNKREFFEKALDHYAQKMGRSSFLRLMEPEASLNEIRVLFESRIDLLLSSEPRNGCMVCNTALELAPHDKEMQAVIQGLMRRMSKAFTTALGNARGFGEIDESTDIQAMGEYLTGLIFGMAVFARAGFNRKKLKTYMENGLSILK